MTKVNKTATWLRRLCLLMLTLFNLISLWITAATAANGEAEKKTYTMSKSGMDLIQMRDHPPSSETVAAFFKQEFAIEFEEYAGLVEEHDTNNDGQLTGDEIMSAVLDIFERKQEEEADWKEPGEGDSHEKPEETTVWLGVYFTTALLGLYLVYALWKKKQEADSTPRAADREQVRQSWMQKDSAAASSHEHPLKRRGAIRRKDLNQPLVDVDNDREGTEMEGGREEDSGSESGAAPIGEVTENEKNQAFDEAEPVIPPTVPKTNCDSELKAEAAGNESLELRAGEIKDCLTVQKDESHSEERENSERPVNLETPFLKEHSYSKMTEGTVDVEPEPVSPAQLVQILSRVFIINVELQLQASAREKFNISSFSVKLGDLPATETDVPSKCHLLLERRLAREYLSKVKLCILTYYACRDLSAEREYQRQPLVQSMMGCLQKKAVQLLLAELQREAASSSDEDDFWSSYATQNSAQDCNAAETELSKFLSRVAGWAEDGVFVGADLLADLIKSAEEITEGMKVIGQIIRSGGQIVKEVKRLDDLKLSHLKTIRGLEIFLNQNAVCGVLAKLMQQEAEQAATGLGSCFEKETTLGPLMSVTSIPTSLSEIVHHFSSPSNAPWVNLQGFPKVTRNDLHTLEGQMQEGLRQVQALIFQTLKRLMKTQREAALTWLATLVNMNESRTTVTAQIQPVGSRDVQPSCSDGFMVNLCSVLLDLCMPFCQGDLDKLSKVEPSYSTSKACRLNYDFETCLGGGQIVCEKGGGSSHGGLAEDLRGTYNFMTEIFHLTQRAMNVGFFPALVHFNKVQKILMSNMRAMEGNPKVLEDMKRKHLLLTLRWDCSLVEQELLRKGTQFYLAQAQWLTALLNKASEGETDKASAHQQQKSVFSQLPEFIVKDMAQWFWFAMSHGMRIHQGALSGLQLSPFVDCCVHLLQRPDLMPGPIPAYRITQALLAFVDDREQKHSRGWGSGVLSTTSSMVFTSPTAQSHLGPALLHAYISVDVVEGLDVDKEDFDKYGARAEISALLKKLWLWSECRTSVLAMCGSERFEAFLGAILDTLLYQLHDSLARLANVKKLQAAKDDGSWETLSEHERKEKETFLLNEEGVAKGFMRMASDTLELLDMLTKCEDVAGIFTVQPLSGRAATAYLGFIDALCGPKASQLKVKDMDKYQFKPRQLLHTILSILLRILQEERSRDLGFLASLANDSDYSQPTMDKALHILRDRGVGNDEMVQNFQTLLEEVQLLRSALQAASAIADDAASNWQVAAQALCISEKELTELYENTMRCLSFRTINLLAHHSFQSSAAAQPVDPRSQKCKALMKELREWHSSLPLHFQASIFIRQDEERMDLVRAVVTGPPDTPYSLGCFALDVYFPATYPNNPPLVKLITTGNGTVRFNPNLYADGKVCLSLLGTWHSGDASQKWQPNKSGLLQVLLSIQSLILCPDPMFNEPGYEGMKESAEVQAKSAEYNAKIRLLTLRHAILGQLKNPPQGLGKIIRHHFRVVKDALLKQCSHWLSDVGDSEEGKKLRRVVDEVRQHLESLQEEEEEEDEERDSEVEEDVEDA